MGLFNFLHSKKFTCPPDVPQATAEKFFKAIEKKQDDKALEILKKYPDAFKWRAKDGFSPLCIAIYANNQVVFEYILKNGGDANEQTNIDPAKSVPLLHHVALHHTSAFFAETLAKHGANIWARTNLHMNDYDPLTARETAFEKSNFYIAKILANLEEENPDPKNLPAPAIMDGMSLQEKFNRLSAEHAQTVKDLEVTRRQLDHAMDLISAIAENNKSPAKLQKPKWTMPD